MPRVMAKKPVGVRVAADSEEGWRERGVGIRGARGPGVAKAGVGAGLWLAHGGDRGGRIGADEPPAEGNACDCVD